MRILKRNTLAELMVKNSRFLSEAISIRDSAEAKTVWHAQKIKYGCSHIVYAFVAGPQGNVMGCSDDGEPAGTAGRPTLEVLKGSGLTNVILTTARWFGGTLLGTGGLVHAYTACAQAALESAETEELVPMREFSMRVTYAEYEPVKRLLAEFGAEITGEDFGGEVTMSGRIMESVAEAVGHRLRDLTSGRVAGLQPQI